MTVIERMRAMFGFQNHPPSSMVDTALQLTRSVSARADHINERLDHYMQQDDPFTSFVADAHNAGTMDRIARDRRP